MNGKLEGIWIKRMKGGPMDAQTQTALKANSGLVAMPIRVASDR